MATDSGFGFLAVLVVIAAACQPPEEPEVCPDPVTQIALGQQQTCALDRAGRLRCLGQFSWTPDGVETFESPPIAIANNAQVCALLANGWFECADFSEGFAGSAIDPGVDGTPVAMLASTLSDEWLLLDDGRLIRMTEQGPVEVDVPGPVAQMDEGGGHMCIATDDGGVSCIGANGQSPGELLGQLGLPGVMYTETFELLPLEQVVGVGLGHVHTCAWFENGEYTCWGSNDFGLLGNWATDPGSTASIGDDETLDNLPTYALDDAVVQIRADQNATCARLAGGSVRCWGAGIFADPHDLLNEGGGGEPLAYDPIPLSEPAIALDVSQSHACVIGESGAVYCWGYGPGDTGATNGWTESDGYLDPETGYVRPMPLEDPAACD